MQQHQTELNTRINHIHTVRSDCYELRIIRTGQPDLMVWRKDDDAIKESITSLTRLGERGKLDGITCFAVTQKNARFDVYAPGGDYLGHCVRQQPPLLPQGLAPDWTDFDSHAKLLLRAPVRVTESWPCDGSPVNLQANYQAVINKLLALDRGEEQLVGVSAAEAGGGDAIYLDVQAARKPVQDLYLDIMRDLQHGNVLCWESYDTEMLRAVQSYRDEDFRKWILQCSGSPMTQEELAFRLQMVPERQRQTMIMEAVSAMLPNLRHWVGDGTPETINRPDVLADPETVVLPPSLLRFLKQG